MSPTTNCLRRVRNTQKSRIASMMSSKSGSSFRESDECKTWTPFCKSDVCMPSSNSAIEASSKSSSSSAGKSSQPV